MGISAIRRPLLSSMLFKVTTSPPTTMLITTPSSHIYNLINLYHTTKIKLLVSGLKCNLLPDKLRCASNTFPVRISNIENSYSDERRLNSERIKTQISNLKEEYEPVEASVPFSCIRKTHWACLRHSVIMSQHAPEVHSWHLDCLRCQTS